MAFQRTRALWSLPNEHVTLGVTTFLSVRINLAKGSKAAKPDPGAILSRALALEAAGVHIVEVQALPLSPVSGIPDAEDELPLLVPVVRKLSNELKVPVSVVTVHSHTAYRVAHLGASIVHDFSGLAYDRLMAPTVNGTDAALILGHMRGAPEQWSRMEPLTNLEEIVRHDFSASLLRADKSNIARQRIVLDPGLEHGKQGFENFNLLRNLRRLAPPAQGLQVTLTGKRFFVESIRASAEQRAAGLAVAATLAVESGAHILTIDDNLAVRQVVNVMDRIYRDDAINQPDAQ